MVYLLIAFVLAPVVLFFTYVLVMEGFGTVLAILGLLLAFLAVTSMLDVGTGKNSRWKREYEARKKLRG